MRIGTIGPEALSSSEGSTELLGLGQPRAEVPLLHAAGTNSFQIMAHCETPLGNPVAIGGGSLVV